MKPGGVVCGDAPLAHALTATSTKGKWTWPYTPRTNGKAKRRNGTLARGFTGFCRGRPGVHAAGADPPTPLPGGGTRKANHLPRASLVTREGDRRSSRSHQCTPVRAQSFTSSSEAWSATMNRCTSATASDRLNSTALISRC